MGVLVCYDEYTYDVINDYHLEHLLDTGCIVGFDRSGVWVKREAKPHQADRAALDHPAPPSA